MVSVMVMTPLHIHHGGGGLRIIGLVLSVHVLGMYAFAPLVGALVDRTSSAAVLAAGALLLLVAVTLAGAAPAGGSQRLIVGLFLLGVGWSCCLVSSSALLVDAVPLVERPGVQGASDLVMGLCAAGGGALAGVMVAQWGDVALNATAGLLALVVLSAAMVARNRLPA
jgi:MFS family permease